MPALISLGDETRFRQVLPQEVQDLFSDVLEVESQVYEYLGRNAFRFSQQSKEQMLCADVIVIETPGLLDRELDDLLGAWRVRELSQEYLVATGCSLDDFLHL